jgi:hypothetical protein
VFGVGHEVKPLADVRRPNAARSKYRLPNGVVLPFNVSLNKVEPAVSNRVISLLSKDRCRSALADESRPIRPEVTRVIKPSAFAGRGETWTGATSRPNRSVIGPSGEAQGVTPDSDSSEEMVLTESCKVFWPHFRDRARIDFSAGDDAFMDEFSEPCRFVFVIFVVVRTLHLQSLDAIAILLPALRWCQKVVVTVLTAASV